MLRKQGTLKKKSLARKLKGFQKENKMKKTIAILLVLVLAGTGLFAAAVDATVGETATITVKTKVDGTALFGVSKNALVVADYLKASTFSSKVKSNVTKNFGNINNLKTEQTVGYLSGFNSTLSDVYIGVGISTLVNQDPGNTATPLTLTLNVDTTTERFKIAKAGAVRGTLSSVEITVIGNEAAIDLAPQGQYLSTITFTITND